MIGCGCESSTGTTRAREYAGAMAGFWSGLSGTLRALERIAGDSRRLDGAEGALRALQYRLHWSSELLAGVKPPDEARAAHAELADALVDARDATGDVAEALERADARRRRGVSSSSGAARSFGCASPASAWLRRPSPRRRRQPSSSGRTRPARPVSSRCVGAIAFVTGAALVLWPVWAAGVALVAGGLLVYRP